MKQNKGYVSLHRQIFDSKFYRISPVTREVFIWLLLQANHRDNAICKRGQCIRSHKDIQEGLHWFKGFHKKTYTLRKIENSMKGLRKVGMCVTRKVTHSTLITICNYDKYQTQNSNECDYEGGYEGNYDVGIETIMNTIME
jgi:hypothetical protein